MTPFYIEQRKRLKILIDKDKKPEGGKWTYDTENRKKLPKNSEPPETVKIKENQFVKEAKKYIETNFSKNYGKTKNFNYPTTAKEAQKWLKDFLKNRFKLFGDYEDAITKEERALYHSMLSPLINSGLLTPDQVINETLTFHQKNETPLNSLEGFIRQIIGWREFIREIYHLEGTNQRNSNHFKHKRKLPESFWKGETGITPIDNTIKKLHKTAYNHHIERLMILGNFMLLCEIKPKEIYTWFMTFYIDAYDWVMVPNVYSMSQYADCGKITTKPYLSSSNYILKMSNYKKGPWCEVWDGLYWRFIHKHKKEFKKNARMRMMVAILEKMESKNLNKHFTVASDFLVDTFNKSA